MRVLLFHGYMLRGTGSNIYNANLAPALARLGGGDRLAAGGRGAHPVELSLVHRREDY